MFFCLARPYFWQTFETGKDEHVIPQEAAELGQGSRSGKRKSPVVLFGRAFQMKGILTS